MIEGPCNLRQHLKPRDSFFSSQVRVAKAPAWTATFADAFSKCRNSFRSKRGYLSPSSRPTGQFGFAWPRRSRSALRNFSGSAIESRKCMTKNAVGTGSLQLLRHGGEILKIIPSTITSGMLSEEPQEASNKDVKGKL